MMTGEFEIYEDSAYEWRWRLKAKNSKIIAVSEGYSTKQGCVKGIKSVLKTVGDINASPSMMIKLVK